MNRQSAVVLATAITAWAAVPASAAQPAGESWEMSGTMEVAGMKMPMPPTTVCMKSGAGAGPGAAAPPMQKNCKVTDVKVRGNTTSFKMECGPPQPMQGTGEMTRTGDRMEGHYTMKSPEGEMVMTTLGRKLGTCTPAPAS